MKLSEQQATLSEIVLIQVPKGMLLYNDMNMLNLSSQVDNTKSFGNFVIREGLFNSLA